MFHIPRQSTWQCPWLMNPFICCISSWPRVSWTHWARNHSLLCCQCKSTWANSVTAAWSTCWLFCCFSDLTLGYRSIYLHDVPSQKADHLSHNTVAQVALPLHWQLICFHCCNQPTGHLPPPVNQYRGEVLAIFLVQRCLNPAGWVSPLQTSAVSMSCQNGFHTVFFHLWCFPTAGPMIK